MDILLSTDLAGWLRTLDEAPTPRRADARDGLSLRGTRDDDRILGEGAGDTLRGLAGDDLLKGKRGDDRLLGGGGDDRLVGGGGQDTLKGGGGEDDLRAGGGADLLNGGGGDDRLNGGGGNDTLIGGKGSDTLRGGGGDDVFLFSSRDLKQGAVDEIVDFGRGADRIDLSRFGVTALDEISFGMLDGDVTIDIGEGRIRLVGVGDSAALGAGDFIFAGGAAPPPDPGPIDPTPPAPPPPSPSPGDDVRAGGAGDDVIPTGAGADTLEGRGGADIFDIRLEAGAIDATPDRVTDFDYAGGDRIGLADALSGVSFALLSEVVRVTPTGGDSVVAIDRGDGFRDALVLEGVSFTTEQLISYGFDLAPRASAGFVENPYGFQNNNAAVADPDATRDGRFVAFAAQDNIDGAPDDVDVASSSDEAFADLDIFVRNTATGATQRASVDGAGATLKLSTGAGADSHSPALSADGRWIAFATNGAGVAGDTNDDGDIYIRDLLNDAAPILISARADGSAAGGVAQPDFAADSISVVDISADGRRVAFVTSADLTGAGQTDANGAHDVYLRDLDAGTTTLISTADGGTAAGGVRTPYTTLGDIVKISDDGRYVAFVTATALSGTDSGNRADVYLKDTQTGRLLHVTDGFETEGVFAFDMSATGGRIAFLTAFAGDADDTNGLNDVYVADIDLGAFAVTDSFRVSEAEGGFQINDGEAEAPVISPDGSRVAWYSAASDIAFFDPFSTETGDQIYIKDIATGALSQPPGPFPDNAFQDSEYGAFTADSFVYRREVPAGGDGSRPVSETIAVDPAAPTPAPEISAEGRLDSQPLGIQAVRSLIETAGDSDVFRLTPLTGTLDIEVLGVDGGGGTLADPLLNIYVGAVDDTPEFTQDNRPSGGRDPQFFLTVSGQTVFLEISSADGGTGSYGLDIEFT